MSAQTPISSSRAPHSRRGNGADPTSTLDLRELLRALQAVRDGDFSVRLPSDQTGLAGKVADTFNEIVVSNQQMARELERVGQIVGKEGKTRHRMSTRPARRLLGRDGDAASTR